MEPKQFLNYKVFQVIGCRETPGEKFGLELELEGHNVGLQDVAIRGWGRHADNSLRGESIEYVTAGALEYEGTIKSIINLFAKFKEHRIKFNDSIRTSTHVHLNFSDKKTKQAINFFCLFTVLEELLQYYSGEDRKGNLFCISSREAEGIINELARCVAAGDFHRFAGDKYKYAACNLSTLYKFGTLEVRTMKGATSAEQITAWVSILNDMYKYSLNMVSPADLVTKLSELGADGFMKMIFTPENYKELMLHFPPHQNLNYSLMEGARLIQLFAFEYDETFKAEVKAEEPKAKKVGKLLKDPRGFLPKRMPNGEMYRIYKPDGTPWYVDSAVGRPDRWTHGEIVGDDRRIHWNGIKQRFIYIDAAGHATECRWADHDFYGNEGNPRHDAQVILPDPEPDDEEIHWDPEDEGDNF
jgi:hypothetical protein